MLGCVFVAGSALAYSDSTDSAKKPAAKPAHAPSAGNAKKGHSNSASKKSKKSSASSRRGQQKIDSRRTQQIQEALIREHYLSGKPSGAWDATTQQALQKYQADNGWQSKTTPDSRALIKLGLGPDHEHLLNPESAMTGQPQPHSPSSSASTSPADPPSQPQK